MTLTVSCAHYHCLRVHAGCECKCVMFASNLITPSACSASALSGADASSPSRPGSSPKSRACSADGSASSSRAVVGVSSPRVRSPRRANQDLRGGLIKGASMGHAKQTLSFGSEGCTMLSRVVSEFFGGRDKKPQQDVMLVTTLT